ncbi:MAG: response regulator transcription factor [Phycisphaerae bacterium]|nr:response regulator transcription factor [Phycisphaerae bacterium]
MAIRIIIADDHTLMRQGLRALISAQPGMEVIAEAGDGRTTVSLAKDLSPDVIIMDISMPDLNGIEATRQITESSKTIKVIGLSMHSDRRFVAQVLKSGASGYLLKDCAFDELTRAIQAVMTDQTYLSPGIAGPVVEDYLRKIASSDTGDNSVLSQREREVLQLLAEGRTTKQIATELQVSGKTIETHRRRIMDKLSIFSVAELTKYAIREGLTSQEK